MKDLFILGACGSIGTQTLDIISNYKDRFRVVAISLGRNLKLGQELIDKFNPQVVCVREKEHLSQIKTEAKCVYGDEGLIYIANYRTENEMVLVNALVGSAGLKPTIAAIKAGKNIALANKETLVMAGELVNNLIKEFKVTLNPIDSEHSAIWQCLRGEKKEDIKNLIITASGGAFRDRTRAELLYVTKEDALKHPNWKMGEKITIDSATMMNKGFEVIEAHFLFDIPYTNIKTILHKESIVHSLVQFNDTSIKAQIGTPDMRIPIIYALNYPEHVKTPSLNDLILEGKTLHFEPLSHERFPMLDYAYYAGNKGGFYPVALNAANEAAVHLFLDGKIKFLDIERIVYEYINSDYSSLEYNIDEIIRLDSKIQKEIYKKYGEF